MSQATSKNIWSALTALCLAMTLTSVAGADTATVVIADFETGVGSWATNDARVDGRAPSELCGIYATARVEDGRTEQAAIIEFKAAGGTWASVRLPVSGQTWLANGAGQIAMWLKGDGTDHTVDLTLRAVVGEDKRDVSYVYTVALTNTDWERRAIRLFAFKDKDGQPITAEALHGTYLIQFVQTGSWPAMVFGVDNIRAEPVAGVNISVTGPTALATTVDFRGLVGPMLGQPGANATAGLHELLTRTSAAGRASAAVRELAPCLVRLRLSDYYRPATVEYDLIALNRAINWVTSAGARPLVCLDLPVGGNMDDLRTTATKLASLRRGGPGLRWYEIFDSPMLTGQFASVEELVAGYNDLSQRVLSADSEARVGGPGLASAWDARVRGFLDGAETLHFVSLKLHGAHTAAADPRTLFGAAISGTPSDLPQQLSLYEVYKLAQSRRPVPEVIVSALAPSSATPAASGNFEAAWMAAALLNGGAYVDRMLHAALIGGMVAADGSSQPVQRAAMLVNTYAPRGATLREVSLPATDLLTVAAWTPTSRNLFVIHVGDGPRTVALDCLGLGSPLLVRRHQLVAGGQIRSDERPKSAQQSVQFDGPGVAVIEFVMDV